MTNLLRSFRLCCLPLLFLWSDPLLLAQLPACNQIPYIQCDSTYAFTSAGEGDYLTQAAIYGNAFYGEERVFRFKALYSDELLLTVSHVTEYQIAIVEIKDSLTAHCFDSSGLAVLLDYSLDTFRTISLGQVQAGHTYYLIFDRTQTDTLHFGLRLHCPDLCNRPGNLQVGRFGANSALLNWQNNALSDHWEMEIRPKNAAFDGTPDYSGQGKSVEAENLQPLTAYHWRVRNICFDTIFSDWSAPGEFVTGPDCNTLADLVCGQSTSFLYPGGPELLTGCNGSNQAGFNGPEVYARFKPQYAGYYVLRFIPDNAWIELGVSRAVADSNCQLEGWECAGRIGASWSEYLNIGFLKADTTYLLAFEFNDWWNYNGETFRILPVCPVACPAPDSLYTTSLTPQSATVGWKAQANQTQWELLLIRQGLTSRDTVYFTTASPFLQLDNLQRGIRFYWQVRGLCGALGNSPWSELGQFSTPPDCALFPPLGCSESLTIPFGEGYGYFQNGVNCHQLYSDAYDQIVTFEVAQNGESRYLTADNGPAGNYLWFWRKKNPAQDCAYPFGWSCLSDSLNGELVQMRDLPSGTYEILIKKRFLTDGSALKIGFFCDLPCAAPAHPYTKIIYASGYLAYWDGGTGPWSYEMELKDEQGNVSVRKFYGPGLDDLFYAFNLSFGHVYEWRVRKICQSGSFVTAWTEWTRFQTAPDCEAAPVLSCGVSAAYGSSGEPYIFWDNCSNTSMPGYAEVYRFKPAQNGQHTLVVKSGNGSPLHYLLTELSLCNTLASGCLTANAADTFDLGLLFADRNYALRVFQTDTALASQTFEIVCPCPPIGDGLGVMHPDGSAILVWYYGDLYADCEIEFIERGAAFTGTPNLFSTQLDLSLSGLDPAKEYRYRVRPVCSVPVDWSPAIDLNREFSCATIPHLTCGTPAEVYVGRGYGLNGNSFTDVFCPGQERFLLFESPVSGVFSFGIQRTDGDADVKIGLFDQCTGSGGPASYYPLIANGFTSVAIAQGHTYTLVFDNLNLAGGTYAVSINCNPPPPVPVNDKAFDSAPWGTLLALPVDIGAPCQVATNRYATADSLDPNPVLPPGNWIDGPEKTVWFYFDAPPGGTVQVNVTSDSMDPQVALIRFDSVGFFGYRVLAAGENTPASTDAMLVYTGLTPGERYLLMVDGVNASEGEFCLEVLDEPTLWATPDLCQTFPQIPVSGTDPEDWINLYAGDGPHSNGPLLAAIRTSDYLGTITVSTEIHPEAPVLSNGQKILPRYFNIETEFQPQSPVKLRLFFTEDDLALFNLTPPADTAAVPQLGITHYDGGSEDCDPGNNATGSALLPVNNVDYEFVGSNGIFYLETTVTQFSEFGGALRTTTPVSGPNLRNAARLFPVPAAGDPTLELASEVPATLSLTVRSVTGYSLAETVWPVMPGLNTRRIDVGGYPAGVYMLELQYPSGQTLQFRIVKL